MDIENESRPSKISPEELQKVQNFINERNVLIFTLGESLLAQKQLNDEIEQLLKDIKRTESETLSLIDTLKKRYGDVTIDAETGDIVQQ